MPVSLCDFCRKNVVRLSDERRKSCDRLHYTTARDSLAHTIAVGNPTAMMAEKDHRCTEPKHRAKMRSYDAQLRSYDAKFK